VQPRAMGIGALAVAPAGQIVPGLTIEGEAPGAAVGRALGRLAATGLVWAWFRTLFGALWAGLPYRRGGRRLAGRMHDRGRGFGLGS